MTVNVSYSWNFKVSSIHSRVWLFTVGGGRSCDIHGGLFDLTTVVLFVAMGCYYAKYYVTVQMTTLMPTASIPYGQMWRNTHTWVSCDEYKTFW